MPHCAYFTLFFRSFFCKVFASLKNLRKIDILFKREQAKEVFIVMRSTVAEMLKKEFRTLFYNVRFSRRYTQEKMSETLCMDTRSYQDLERGVSLCSLTTFYIFKVQFPDVDLSYIDELIAELFRSYYDLSNADD